MATASHAQAVKSLNTSSDGGGHFVFKKFSQRINEIDIDVYKSLDPLSSHPSEGSSFVRDCLVEYRELNTAEYFISFYEAMMPHVQTLPLVLLHKKLIFDELISRLKWDARLSLEPILRLIAALSRDLLEDFVPFLPSFADASVSLLEHGADKDPETIEQIFISWSYILMYLQKYLVRDIVHAFKATVKLRYYPKGYIQEFVAEAMAFLLRNAVLKQQFKCIKMLMLEVAEEPLSERRVGVSALISNAMKGTSVRFHSKADTVLQILLDKSLYSICDKLPEGSDAALSTVTATFVRLSGELESKELNLMWNCLYNEMSSSFSETSHLRRLLSIAISVVRIESGRKVSDYESLLSFLRLLIQTFIGASHIESTDDHSKVVDEVLRLMLCTLDGLHASNNSSAISVLSSEWGPVFQLRDKSLLNFIKELLQKDPYVLHILRVNITKALNDLIETYGEAVHLVLTFWERTQAYNTSSLEERSMKNLSRICAYLRKVIFHWIQMINDMLEGELSSTDIGEADMTLLLKSIRCSMYMLDEPEDRSLLMDLVNVLDRLLMTSSKTVGGYPKHSWQSLLGAALDSYCSLLVEENIRHEEVGKYLQLAKRNKLSSPILHATANFLDSWKRSVSQDNTNKVLHPDLKAEKVAEAVGVFFNNLCHSSKELRISSLRILSHYEPLSCESSKENQPMEKKRKTEASESCSVVAQHTNVIELLLLIEQTAVPDPTSRKAVLLISRIQMAVSAGAVPEDYVPLVMCGILGVLHNRFKNFQNPAIECLAVLIAKHVGIVWEKYVDYLEQSQAEFLETRNQIDRLNAESSGLKGHDSSFHHPASDSTPSYVVLSLLLETLQRIPSVAESHSRQIIPLFLKFLGYTSDHVVSVGSFDANVCKVKDWKLVLKEWLNLLKLMRNARAFYRSEFLKDVMINRLVDENDAEIQMRVLDCLVLWKDSFLLPYEQNLRNLISSKHLREELATWSISKEANSIDELHRAELVPLVIRVLIPKVRKLKTLGARKHTNLSHRKAVLSFIANLEINELALFFALLIKPLQLSLGGDGSDAWFWGLPNTSLAEFQAFSFFKCFTKENIMVVSWKKSSGFLHVIEEVLGVFDVFHIKPFIDLLMGCVVRVLESCTTSLGFRSIESASGNPVIEGNLTNQVKMDSAEQQSRYMRSLCLKIISRALHKFEDYDFGSEFWDIFFNSVKLLIDNFKQEGASSNKPSSLFSCFIAMSRSRKLVPLLHREKNLVPDVFSILTVHTASDDIVGYVLEFIRNLLILDNEFGDDDNFLNRMLLLNFETLISSLHCLFHTTKRKLVKYPGERELEIFKLLAKYTKDSLLGRKFLEILLPFLERKTPNSDSHRVAVLVIREIIPVLGKGTAEKILHAVYPLLVSAELNLRLIICDLLDRLAEVDNSILVVARLVRELNATSSMEIDDLDYDTIISAYGKISSDFFHTLQEDHALVVLSHCVYDMSSGDIILRHSAYRSLVSFLEYASLHLGKEVNNQDILRYGDNDHWSAACMQRFVNKFLLSHLGDAVKKGGSLKEWMDLLQQMVLKLPQVPDLNCLEALSSSDPETDFFNNIVHMQKHRRSRALSRFKEVVSAGNLTKGILSKVFIPFIFNMMFDAQGGTEEHIKNACLEALATVSSRLEWSSYYALLKRCLRELTIRTDRQKLLWRLICRMLDNFHFLEHDVTQTGQSARIDDAVEAIETQKSIEIQLSLHKSVLPKIQKHLSSESDDINVNVSLAALKLLKLLPKDIMESQLSSIVHRISNFLKNHRQSTRDEARSALAACLKELGPEYLPFIIRVLRATLKRGYELHVLGFTVHFILEKTLINPNSGRLDYCLKDLIDIAENDIFGDTAEEKEVEKIASKMNETKKLKSFETLKLIAQNITFRTHASKLLSPISFRLQRHLTPKVKSKVETMLSRIAVGLESNPSVDRTELFVFVYGLIKDGINEVNQPGENVSALSMQGESEIDGKAASSSSRLVGSSSQSSHFVTVFALTLLQSRLKKMALNKNDEKLLEMLDPIVNLLGSCLSSKYGDVTSLALKCLAFLIKLPLPSYESQSPQIKAALLDIAQSSINTNSPLMESCLRLLIVLLRSMKITLSTDQLHMLFQFPLFVDLERNPSSLALSLLKAIVSRRLVVHEIYDVVTQVAKLMVTSQDEAIRKKSSKILLQFFLDYRLSAKRLQQHLDSLLADLRYEHSSGREAALEMLHTIIIKFPESSVDKQSQIFFVHLVERLINDRDNNVRSMTGEALKLLVGRVGAKSLDTFLQYSLSWYLGGKHDLWGAGAQVLGLLVEALSGGFQKHLDIVLPVTKKILHSAVDAVTSSQIDLSEGNTVPLWKEAYYSLVLLEKMLLQFNGLCFRKDLEDLWSMISEFLLHPHVWLRDISGRLVCFYFTMLAEPGRENGASLKTFYLMRPSRVFMVAVSFCCQLKTQMGDSNSSNLLTQNLVFALCYLHTLMGPDESVDPHAFWSTLDQKDQGFFLRAFQLLNPGKRKGLFASLISAACCEKDKEANVDPRYVLVSTLLKGMGKVALQMETVQMKLVFNSFKAFSSRLGTEDCQQYAYLLLQPLYKASEGFAGKVVSDELKQLAQQVRDSIAKTLGTQNFVQVYSQIRKNLKSKRDKRKQEQKVMAVVNPVRNAKRKMRIAEKHKANKKRKIMTMKMGRFLQ